jgi:RNA polymerase sigma factor (sigma-70 family)
MSNSTRADLRSTLVAQYEWLRNGLARRLGSTDLASEALHEMWIKLSEGGDLAPVADQPSYVFRGALNAARDLESARRRVLGHVEIQAIIEMADETPGPDRILEAKSELAALQKALKDLKPRQREIFVAALYEEVDHETLAARYGVSIRMIQMELRNAILHCARRTARKNLFAPGALRVSRK